MEEQLVDEVTFAIGCTCNYGVRLGANMVTAQPGDRLVFNTSAGRLYGVSAQGAGASVRLLPLDGSDTDLWPGGVGSWPMHVYGDLGLTDDAAFAYGTDPDAPAQLDITVFEPGQRLYGSIAGAIVDVFNPENPWQTGFDWWFAITYPPGGFQCIVGEDEG